MSVSVKQLLGLLLPSLLAIGCGSQVAETPHASNVPTNDALLGIVSGAADEFVQAVVSNDVASVAAHLQLPVTRTPEQDAELERWLAGQRKGLLAQFDGKLVGTRVELVEDGSARLYVLKDGKEHIKPVTLRKSASGAWRIDLYLARNADRANAQVLGSEDEVREVSQAFTNNRYTFPTVLTNYTIYSFPAVCADNASGWLSTPIYSWWPQNTIVPWCPSWQCTWFGSTCTFVGAYNVGSGSPVCANQVAGDDAWFTAAGAGCYAPWN